MSYAVPARFLARDPAVPVVVITTGADVAVESAVLTLVRGDLTAIVRAMHLSRATTRNIRQNLWFAFAYNVVGVSIAAGALYRAFGLVLSPMVAAAAMSLPSVSVIGNALRLRGIGRGVPPAPRKDATRERSVIGRRSLS